MPTNVPNVQFTDRGFVAPVDALILAGVQADQNAAFGGNLNPDLTEPQGQLAVSGTAIISDADGTFVLFSNQVDPAFATGRMQDAIGRIYFLTRKPSAATVVLCTVTGRQGVTIPVGAQAKAQDGNIYLCNQSGTFDVTGTMTLPFACATFGPIPCPEDSVAAIYQAIPGWDTINNPSDGVEGRATETRVEFEERRQQSVAKNARGIPDAVLGEILGLSGVLDAYVYSNNTASPITISGHEIPAKAIYIAVVGGLATDIADAIYRKLNPGPEMDGNTDQSIQITDNYNPPYPTYTMSWETPAALSILFQVTLQDNPGIPADATTQIQLAIQGAFNGQDGGPRARIGNLLLASRYMAPVLALGPWAQVISLKIGSANVPGAIVTTSTITATALAIGSLSSGTIAIGQTVLDVTGAVLPGTRIISGSGSSWVVNQSQTVSSEDMTLASAGQDSVQVGIAQVPTLNIGNVVLVVQS